MRQIELVASCRPEGIILREKDLAEADYLALADKVNAICERYEVRFIAHTFPKAARGFLHLPIAEAVKFSGETRVEASCQNLSAGEMRVETSCQNLSAGETRVGASCHLSAGETKVGASCHSPIDVAEAERAGCEYVTFGHIFPTECKRGVAPRGLKALEVVCSSAKVPVYAIGGIDASNARLVIEAGASGVCIMSGTMNEGAEKLIKELVRL